MTSSATTSSYDALRTADHRGPLRQFLVVQTTETELYKHSVSNKMPSCPYMIADHNSLIAFGYEFDLSESLE